MELEKQKRETNREIDKLQRELLFTKNSVELKILSEKIMEIKVQSGLSSSSQKCC